MNVLDDLNKIQKVNGTLLVISGPSGVGKGTVVGLFKKYSEFDLSVSATTRKPRIGEVDGFDYYFISRNEFENKIKNSEFLEYADYCGNYYGTLKSDVQHKLSKCKFLVLEIEVAGFQKLRKFIPNDDIPNFASVFIIPPSIQELESRLRNRGKDDDETIKQRIVKAKQEITLAKYYDFVVKNDFPEICVEKIYRYLNKLF